MPFGVLQANIILDFPHKIHYGSQDLVRGNVTLTYSPTRKSRSAPSLFGPLLLALTFEGHVRIKVAEGSESSRNYENDSVLFRISHQVYDGPLKMAVNEEKTFSFAIGFPTHTNLANHVVGYVDGSGQYRIATTSSDKPGHQLPPCCKITFFRTDLRRAGSSITYELKPQVTMPGIDVDIQISGYTPNVRYKKARIARPPTSAQTVVSDRGSVTSKALIPERERPLVVKARARAAFLDRAPKPTYFYEIRCRGLPQQICLGQSMMLDVIVHANEELTTSKITPDTTLDSINIEVYTTVPVAHLVNA